VNSFGVTQRIERGKAKMYIKYPDSKRTEQKSDWEIRFCRSIDFIKFPSPHNNGTAFAGKESVNFNFSSPKSLTEHDFYIKPVKYSCLSIVLLAQNMKNSLARLLKNCEQV
jgi:hypothetical protein